MCVRMASHVVVNNLLLALVLLIEIPKEDSSMSILTYAMQSVDDHFIYRSVSYLVLLLCKYLYIHSIAGYFVVEHESLSLLIQSKSAWHHRRL